MRPWLSAVRVRATGVPTAGVPAARDQAGRAVDALFAPGTVETALVETYGPRLAPEGAQPKESDREYLEKLRSLGYLK